MTACVNKKSKRVAAVVTASLVGALSIGAPAVALAANNTSIDMLAADWTTGAKLSGATDGRGNQLTGDLSKQAFVIGSGKYLVPTEVTSDFATTDVTGFTMKYTVKTVAESESKAGKPGLVRGWAYNIKGANGTSQVLKVAEDATTVELSAEQAAAYFSGNLYDCNGDTGAIGNNAKAVVVAPETVKVAVSDAKGSASFAFKVVDAKVLDSVKVKGQLVYNGKDQKRDIKFVDSEGYDVTTGDVSYADATGHPVNEIKSASDYVATVPVTVDGVTNTFKVRFSVAKLDLSEAVLSIDDQVGAFTDGAGFLNALKLNGKDCDLVREKDVDFTKIVNPAGGSEINGGAGSYEVTLSAVKDATNVSGSAVVKFNILNEDLTDGSAQVLYGRNELSDNGTINIWLVDGESFDASKLGIKGDDGETYKGDAIEVTYIDTVNNKAVEASDLSKAGTYKAEIRIKAFQNWENEQWYGGSMSVNINVNPAQVSSSKNLAFYFDGELSGGTASPYYDGTDALKRLEVVVKADGKTYAEGTDYTLEVKKDGKAVTEAVDAGEYTVTVKPLTFKFEDGAKTTFTLTVKKAVIGRVEVDGVEVDKDLKDLKYVADDPDTNEDEYVNDAVAYTGEDLATPAAKYVSEVKDNGDLVYSDLDAKLYKVASLKKGTKSVKAAKDAGTYTVKIALTEDAAKNYQLADDTFEFQVAKYNPFLDVESPAWYASPLETAKHNGYVKGVGNTGLFSPNADITRADAVCVLYNMAGGKLNADGEFGFSEEGGYVTGFSDVDGHAYFAKALAWAKAAGVANGSNGQFRPYDKITREEFASLLANFSKVKGDYVAVDADKVLGSATDYSAWAKANVAWAKANGIMGNNGSAIDGTGNITRAQVAAMAVNYQPEKL